MRTIWLEKTEQVASTQVLVRAQTNVIYHSHTTAGEGLLDAVWILGLEINNSSKKADDLSVPE